jgi:gliding motility-associated-like protein
LTEPTALALELTHTNVNCTGSTLGTATANASGGTGTYVYSWSNGQTTSSILNLNPGLYRVTIADNNSCSVIDSVEVVQNTEVSIEINVEKPISCNGLSDGTLIAVAQDGVPPYNYSWDQGGPSSDRYSGLGEGTYTVSVVDNDGCEGMQSINLSDPERLIPYFEVYDVSCFSENDGYVEVDATGGNGNYMFYWNGQELIGNTAEDLIAGGYTLLVEDEENCQADTLVIVSEPDKLRVKVKEAATKRPFCPDWANGVLALNVTGGTKDYSFVWQESAENDSVIRDVREGWYEVLISDAHGCSVDTSFRLKALNDNCLNIPTAFTPNDDEANNYWEIRYLTENGAEVRFNEVYPVGEMKIYDRLGNLVYHCSGGCPEDWNGEDMHGRRLPVDTYYFVIDLNNGNGNDMIKGIVTIIR